MKQFPVKTKPALQRLLSSFLLFLVVFCFLYMTACSNPAGGPEDPKSAPGSEKAITAFSIGGIDGEIEGTTVYVKNIPLYTGQTENTVTDLRSLTPVITHSGESIEPSLNTARNFTAPVTYTVTAEDGSQTVWTIIVKLQPLAPAADIGNYLDKAEDVYAGIAAEPIPLPLSIDLSTGWAGLLTAIQTAGKYVALDLSACDITGMTSTEGEFDPGAANTGEGKIVSLVLPNGALTIKAGADYNNPTFKNFTGLTSVSGEHVTTVGGYAFYNCSALETVSLPVATSIGSAAFSSFSSTGTQELTITLGNTVPTLGNRMFNGVTADKTVTVKVPSGVSAWNDKTGAFTGTDTTVNWGNGFRGGGWDGSAFVSNGVVNDNINLTVKTYAP
jgi:hypothetical protein